MRLDKKDDNSDEYYKSHLFRNIIKLRSALIFPQFLRCNWESKDFLTNFLESKQLSSA